MIVQQAYVNEKNEAAITCVICGEERMVNAAKCRKHSNRIVAKCSCGFTFFVVFRWFNGVERRRRFGV